MRTREIEEMVSTFLWLRRLAISLSILAWLVFFTAWAFAGT